MCVGGGVGWGGGRMFKTKSLRQKVYRSIVLCYKKKTKQLVINMNVRFQNIWQLFFPSVGVSWWRMLDTDHNRLFPSDLDVRGG